MSTKLIAQQEFTSGGVTYGPGDVIPHRALSTWPEGALDNRVRSGFVTWDGAPDVTEDDGGADEDAREKELAALSAAELKELAATLGIPYTNKAEAVEAILAAEADGPRVTRSKVLTRMSADEVKGIAGEYEITYTNKGEAIEAIVVREFDTPTAPDGSEA